MISDPFYKRVDSTRLPNEKISSHPDKNKPQLHVFPNGFGVATALTFKASASSDPITPVTS